MAASDDPKTLGRTRLSFAEEADIDEFLTKLQQFESGELPPDQWRAFRLLRGTYGQRQEGDFSMLRVKVPQGVLDGKQLRALADVSERYSRGFGHITTRQNLQFHFVRLHDAEPAMRELAEAGLTTREACGNSVRNVTCCPYAGVAHDEPFDVTPYAEAVTRYLLRHPLTSSLPRKFKIAAEGCVEDHAFTAINDLGYKAAVREEGGKRRRGFRITAGGGTAILCKSGNVLHEFLPAAEVLDVAEALVRVFHRLGDREHRQRNRSKFLIQKLGFEGFRAEYEQERADILANGGAALPFDPEQGPVEVAPTWSRPQAPSVEDIASRVAAAVVKGPGLPPSTKPQREVPAAQAARWKASNVKPQRQPGYARVTVTLPLGDLTGAQLRVAADLAEAYGDGLARVTTEQNLLFRWVRETEVDALYTALAAAGLHVPDASQVADVTSCPGAESCKLAVTQSRGLGKLLGEFLHARPDLTAAAPEVKIKISGCPNGCGLHHIAGIGFQGSLRKLGAKAVPQYFVMLGGGIDAAGASFGRIAAKVPARRAPQALERLVQLYRQEKREGEQGLAFFRRLELSRAKQLLADLEVLTPETAAAEDFIDLGDQQEFKHEVMEGECAA